MNYKTEIVEMIEKINTPRFLKMILGFVKVFYREEVQNNERCNDHCHADAD